MVSNVALKVYGWCQCGEVPGIFGSHSIVELFVRTDVIGPSARGLGLIPAILPLIAGVVVTDVCLLVVDVE